MPTIDEYSTAAVPIEMWFNDRKLSCGTAFFWHDHGQNFLITNWHNVTGVNPATGKNLSPEGGRPNRLLVLAHATELGSHNVMLVNLYDENGDPRWWVHPQHRQLVDIVAIPIEPLDGIDFHPINRMPQQRLRMLVGEEVFILGFPFISGLVDRDGTPEWPVWKRASIAFEPDMIKQTELFMLVDTASRPGMSGSPVIRRAYDSWPIEGGPIQISGGTATRFVGVYAGRRASEDKEDAQLGRVYPAKFLEELIAGRAKGTTP